MSDLTVILDRKELVVRMESKSIRVERPDGPPERLPLGMVDKFIVVGNPMVSCDVWRALAQENIPAVLIPSRGGGLPAYLGSGLSATVKIRVAQHQAVNDKKCLLKIGRWLLHMKMKGQEAVLRKFGNGAPDLNVFCVKIRECQTAIKEANDRNSLMGYEGAAASEYFSAFAEILPKKWKFSGRNRRPPRDPVNALLSLSYVLAGGEVRRVIHQKGLDPAVGLLHSIQPGRESLVLDIMEPIRPEVDWFVFEVLELLNLTHFTTNEQDGCLLNKRGRSIFFKTWALWKKSEMKNKNPREMAQDIVQQLIVFFPDS